MCAQILKVKSKCKNSSFADNYRYLSYKYNLTNSDRINDIPRISHMHHKYQLNRDKRFVKTVNTKNKLNCINLQLAIWISKNRSFQTCIIVKRICITIFSKIGLVDRSKPCTQIYLHFFFNLHKFATCNYNFEKSRLSDMHCPLTDIQAHFEINGTVRYRNTAKKEIISKDDRRTNGRTDGQTSRTTTIGSFFETRKNY